MRIIVDLMTSGYGSSGEETVEITMDEIKSLAEGKLSAVDSSPDIKAIAVRFIFDE